MRHKSLRMIASCLSLFGAATLAAAFGVAGPDEQKVLPLVLRGVYFVPNHGQWSDSDVHFGLRSRGLDIAFRESSLTMHLARETVSASRGRQEALVRSLDALLADGSDSLGSRADYEHLTLTVTFPASNDVLPEGGKPQAAKFNYFVGGEGRGVASDVPSFGAVVYHNLYDGVDLHVMGSEEGVLKYEFHVAPGMDYSQIRIAYDGIESLCIDESGDLHIATTFGTLADGAPVVLQENSGTAVPAVCALVDGSPQISGRDARYTNDTIPARFELCDAHTYRIALDGPVDPDRELIIDPDVAWMTYLGGSSADGGNGGIAVDSAGNALVTGWTGSADFEGRNNAFRGGLYDAFVVKVNASGALQWMTYLGGSGWDVGSSLALDSAGNALVTGDTTSTDFEGRNNALHGSYDALVVKVSASGALQWMTYLGGSGDDWGYGVAVDSAGHALVTGTTYSPDFEGRNNAYHGGDYDAFVVKLRTADGPQLVVNATCPSGGPIQVSWSGATGGETIVLLYARNTGSFRIPNGNPCAGTQTGLGSNQIQIAYQGSAGPSGSRTVNSTTGPRPCGGYLQLLDIPTCGTSNVVRME